MKLTELFEAVQNFDYSAENWESNRDELICKAIESDRISYLPVDWIDKAVDMKANMDSLKKEILEGKAEADDKEPDTDSDETEESAKRKASKKKPVDNTDEPKQDPSLADDKDSTLKKAADILRCVASMFDKADEIQKANLSKANSDSDVDSLVKTLSEIVH